MAPHRQAGGRGRDFIRPPLRCYHNDGLDDWSGESWFFGLGRYWDLFD
jgi:hypothetical protein